MLILLTNLITITILQSNVQARYIGSYEALQLENGVEELLQKNILRTGPNPISLSSSEVKPEVILIIPTNDPIDVLRTGVVEPYNMEEEKRKRKEAQMVIEQHQKKMKEINDFMKDHLTSTNYFYDEMKRILRTNVVKDGVRKMVDYLDKSENKSVRTEVLKCFLALRKKEAKPYDVFKHSPNNLVIHYIGDPFNEGYVN